MFVGTIVGRITNDLVLRTVQVNGSERNVLDFSVASNRLKLGGKKTERKADFVNVTVWYKLAETCAKFLRKGSRVSVTGRIEIEEYEGTDGNKKTKVCIANADIEFLDGRPDEQPVDANDEENNSASDAPQKRGRKPKTDDESLPY
ncbi:MAG TPA: single-stranded DNA-binding protein [Clostridia bacterium]|nr:single-stranded DNA-binding protein [Clostridia bacterium]